MAQDVQRVDMNDDPTRGKGSSFLDDGKLGCHLDGVNEELI